MFHRSADWRDRNGQDTSLTDICLHADVFQEQERWQQEETALSKEV